MKYLINAILVVALAVFTIQCEVVSDDLLDNPNNPSPDQASADFLLNSVQLGTVNFFGNIENEASDMTRTTHMFANTYPSAYQPQFFDGEWSTAYATVLIDVQTVIPVAQGRELFTHEAMARLMKAYVLINLADRFGDVPVNEALDSGNFNPAPESGRTAYQTAFAEIDSARIALDKEALAPPSDDLFYDGDKGKWLTFANTLELKGLYQQHKISDPVLPAGVSDFLGRINTLLDGDVIRTAEQSLIFQYGTNTSNPDTRHPYFTGNYLAGGAQTYMANYYMNELFNGKGANIIDPRIRYYLYRQVDEPTTDVNEQECVGVASPPSHYRGNGSGTGLSDPWCVSWNDVGYWGRDHGDSDGIPPDNLLRTTYGPYPGGGRFDADQAEGVDGSQGLQGAGIRPMWMHFFTDFVEAEVELAQGNIGPAATALENGIRNSIDFVMAFSAPAVAATDGSDFEPTENDIDEYVGEVLDRFNNQATTNREKETLLANEFHLALFGNGVEAYNLYRRVAPAMDDPWWRLQPNLTPDPGQFYNTLIYPAAFVQRNSNANTKSQEVRPFWMTADPGFGNF